MLPINIFAMLRMRLGAAVSITRLACTAAALLLAGGAPARADILFAAQNTTTQDSILRFNSANPGAATVADKFIPSLGLGLNPVGIAFDSAGKLYVGNIGWGAIQRRDGSTGAFLSNITGVPEYTYGLAFDPADNLYVSAHNSDTILRVSLSGQITTFADASDGLDHPWGVALDHVGNLFVANYGNNTILKFDITTGVSSVFADSSDGLNRPRYLAFDTAGNLFATSASNNSVFRFAPDGASSLFADADDGLSNPTGLAFDSVGRLYVGNIGVGSIFRFDAAGNGSAFMTSTSSILGLAFTDDAGRSLLLPVPEPGSALLLLGAGGLMLGLGRRRKG